MIEMAAWRIWGQGEVGAFGSFMISRPILNCSHWSLEFVYTWNAAMMS